MLIWLSLWKNIPSSELNSKQRLELGEKCIKWKLLVVKFLLLLFQVSRERRVRLIGNLAWIKVYHRSQQQQCREERNDFRDKRKFPENRKKDSSCCQQKLERRPSFDEQNLTNWSYWNSLLGTVGKNYRKSLIHLKLKSANWSRTTITKKRRLK